jgi:hypothetical protein
MSICQTTWDYRLFDSRGVAPRASRVLTLRVQPAESIVPTSATGVTPAVITKRTSPACHAAHFQSDKPPRQR